MKDGYTAYRDANVDTADQGKLILIAYDVAIKNCKQALEKFSDQKQIEARTRHLLKVQDAVTELMGALKMDVGKIAQNLYALYDYMLRRLIHANARGDEAPVKEVLGYLTDLRAAWNDAIQSLKRAAAPEEAPSAAQNFAITG